MKRYPWRARVILAAVASAVAGVYGAEAAAGTMDESTAGAVAMTTVLAILGVIVNGEEKTTPVSDPVDRHGDPLVPDVLPETMLYPHQAHQAYRDPDEDVDHS